MSADAVPLLLSLLYGLVRGASHAFEPDHLAAVSTLLATEPRRRRVMALGLVWGIGHALAIVSLSIVLLAMRAQLPVWASRSLEVLVAIVLLYLGGMAIARAFQRGPLGAVHRHRHGGVEHEHAGSDDHLHLGKWTLARRSLIVGLMHGLAGSGALTALALSKTSSFGAGILYTGLFGIGSVLGMGAVVALMASALRRIITSPRAERVLLASAGSLSVLTGLYWLAVSV
jgi:hypothetical protein